MTVVGEEGVGEGFCITFIWFEALQRQSYYI